MGIICEVDAVSTRVSGGAHRGPMSNRPRTPRNSTLKSQQLSLRLDVEWKHLRRQRSALRTVRAWAHAVGSVDDDHVARFADTVDLNDLVHATQHTAGPDGDRLLLAMVVLAKHDQLAGRILVQRLLPGLVTASVRYRSLCDHDDPVAEAVGSLWTTIARYDTDRRTVNVAASLISDTTFTAFKRRARTHGAEETIAAPDIFDDRPTDDSDDPLVQLAAVVRDAQDAGVPTYDLDLIRQLVATGSPGVVARAREVSPRTIRNHRDRAISRVRRAVGPCPIAA
jgi:hypothetical protein